MTENEHKLLMVAKQLNDLCKSQYDVVSNVREIWQLTTQLLRITLKHLNEDRGITDQEMADSVGLTRSSIQAQRVKQ